MTLGIAQDIQSKMNAFVPSTDVPDPFALDRDATYANCKQITFSNTDHDSNVFDSRVMTTPLVTNSWYEGK